MRAFAICLTFFLLIGAFNYACSSKPDPEDLKAAAFWCAKQSIEKKVFDQMTIIQMSLLFENKITPEQIKIIEPSQDLYQPINDPRFSLPGYKMRIFVEYTIRGNVKGQYISKVRIPFDAIVMFWDYEKNNYTPPYVKTWIDKNGKVLLPFTQKVIIRAKEMEFLK